MHAMGVKTAKDDSCNLMQQWQYSDEYFENNNFCYDLH